MLIAPKRLKLWTLNLVCMFLWTVSTFSRWGVARGVMWPVKIHFTRILLFG